jgi:peptide deformylase
VGIDAQVAVVNVRKPVVLINPKIISKENEINYYEGCLSYPKKGVHTKRFETIEITSDNVEGSLIFSGVETSTEGKGSWEKSDDSDRDLRLLETVCVQHEIDHLNGIICMDRKIETSYKRTEKKVGRNEPCPCGSGKKYKKCCQ